MNSETLIAQVEACQANHWQNSDLYAEDETLLELIARHLKRCKPCQEAFDVFGFEGETLTEFARAYMANTQLDDWVCGD